MFNEEFMQEALKEAETAKLSGDIPVGAVVVLNGEIIARGRNLRVANFDATAHAEVVAIREAGKALKRWNLADCDLYVTLEPCAMCAGAIVNARIANVYFGAYDHRFGCCGTLMNIAAFDKLNHRAAVTGGIMAEECGKILSDHFKALRNKD